MANVVEIKLENGVFNGVKSSKVSKCNKHEIVANDWLVRIHEDASLEALCFKKMPDGVHSVRAVITPEGKFKSTRRVPNGKEGYKYENLKESNLSKDGISSLNGTLLLSVGDIDSRYVTFRDKEYVTFLKKNELSYYNYSDPNVEYSKNYMLFTDGSVEEMEEKCEVSGASWVIVLENGVRKIVTNKNYRKLLLPRIVPSIKGYMKKLNKCFNTVEESESYINRFFDCCDFQKYDTKEDMKSDKEEIRATYYYDKEKSIIIISIYQYLYWNTPESVAESGVKNPIYDTDKKKFFKKNLIIKAETAFVEI